MPQFNLRANQIQRTWEQYTSGLDENKITVAWADMNADHVYGDGSSKLHPLMVRTKAFQTTDKQYRVITTIDDHVVFILEWATEPSLAEVIKVMRETRART